MGLLLVPDSRSLSVDGSKYTAPFDEEIMIQWRKKREASPHEDLDLLFVANTVTMTLSVGRRTSFKPHPSEPAGKFYEQKCNRDMAWLHLVHEGMSFALAWPDIRSR